MLLDDVKVVLRISNTAFNSEITDLIETARQDLILSGVTSEKAIDDADPLIKRALSVYVKANFGLDNPDADRLMISYNMLKHHLTLSREYSGFAITFVVQDGITPLENAKISFNGEERITNGSGQALFFGVDPAENMQYSVMLPGFLTAAGAVDVSGSKSVAVALVVA